MEFMDRYLCEFFYNVMDNHLLDFLNIEKAVRDIKRGLSEIRRKCKGDKDKTKEDLVHSFPIQKCALKGKENAYFYECSTCLASATAKTFQELAENNQETFKNIVQKKTINICCIAGGVASELVAVIKVLSNLSKNHTRFSLKFITASDIWDNITTAVLTELQRSYEKEVHKIKLSWDFVIVRNKEEHGKQEILEIFQSVDILLATKFSQDISEMPEKQLEQLLQVAFPHMKTNSLFFFMDTSTADFIKGLEKELSNQQSFQNIHKQVSLYHMLSLKALEDHVKRYREHFGADLNSSYCILSVFAWLRVNRKRNAKQKGISVPNVKPHQLKKEQQEERGNLQEFRKRVENFFDKPQTLELENLVSISSSNIGNREANASDNDDSKCAEVPEDEKTLEPQADISPNTGTKEANTTDIENSKCTVVSVDAKSLEPLPQKGQADRSSNSRTRKRKKRNNRKSRLRSQIENVARTEPANVTSYEPQSLNRQPESSPNTETTETNTWHNRITRFSTAIGSITIVNNRTELENGTPYEHQYQKRPPVKPGNIGTREANISGIEKSKCTVVPVEAKSFEALSQEQQVDRSPNTGTTEANKWYNRLFSATQNIPALFKRVETENGTSSEPRYQKRPPVKPGNIGTREANISGTEKTKCTVVPVDAKPLEPLSKEGQADISSNIGNRETKISGTENSKSTVVQADAKSLETLFHEEETGPSRQHESLKDAFQATMESSVEKILTFQREMNEKYLDIQKEYLKSPSRQHEILKDVFRSTVESTVEKVLTFQREMNEKYLDFHKEYLKIEKEKLKIRREMLEFLKKKKI